MNLWCNLIVFINPPKTDRATITNHDPNIWTFEVDMIKHQVKSGLDQIENSA